MFLDFIEPDKATQTPHVTCPFSVDQSSW
jgi:hypothetical protein